MRPVALLFRCCLVVLPLALLLPTALPAQAVDVLTVKVRDIADNSPISGATVSLYNDKDVLVDAQISSDEDGTVVFEFDPTLSVNERNGVANRLGAAEPNPFASQTSLSLATTVAGRVSIGLYDLLGRPVLTTDAFVSAGTHQVRVDLGRLPAGRYLVRAVQAGEMIGSSPLIALEGNRGGEGSITLSGGSGHAGADRTAIPGLFRIEITHPEYRTAVRENVEISGKVVQVIQLEAAFFVPEFGEGIPTYTVVADARSGLDVPRDLEFHPDRENELWVVNRAYDGTVTYYDAGTEQMTSKRVRDGYAFHFMEEVSAIAFGVDGLFGTAQESINTYDNQATGNFFMGPALWTSDMEIYSKNNLDGWGDLGSHLDMLHESPNGMGIAHDHGNAYWYFDGHYGNIVYYDFQEDHGPGWDDHSDGIVRRYVDAVVRRIAGVPGHMVLDKATGWLYIADPGNRRVTRLDTKSGARIGSGNIDNSQMEPLAEYSRYGGATYEVFAGDNLTRPSGIALYDGRLFVGDNTTGEIIAYDLEGKELNRIQTPAASLMGLEVGPDGKIWYVDAETNQVVRIDPKSAD